MTQSLNTEEVGHTPGPWTSERDLPYNRMPRVHGADNSLICECGNMGTTQDQWEVNARLIAAAPKLLEALISLRKYVKRAPYAVIMACDAAISEATQPTTGER